MRINRTLEALAIGYVAGELRIALVAEVTH